MATAESRPVAADGLLHPVPLGAMVLLGLNDHVFKHAWPGWVTGKLSDFAGLVFFPLLLQAAIEVAYAVAGRECRPSRRVLWGCAAATAVVFAAAELFPWGTDAYRYGLGALQWPIRAVFWAVLGRGMPPYTPVVATPDPSDCLAIPGVLVAVWAGWRRAT